MAKIMDIVNVLLPVLWSTAGPAFVVMVTATLNKLSNLYIPRAIQIPLAGIVSAVAAGIAGVPVETGLVEGMAVQGALSLSPRAFLASAKE